MAGGICRELRAEMLGRAVSCHWSGREGGLDLHSVSYIRARAQKVPPIGSQR